MEVKNNLFQLMPSTQREPISSAVLAFILASGDSELLTILCEKLSIKRTIKKVYTEKLIDSGAQDSRIDILVECLDGSVVAIENKHWHTISKDQLTNYRKALDKRYEGKNEFILLAPEKHIENTEYLWEMLGEHRVKGVTWESLLDSGASALKENQLWGLLNEFVFSAIERDSFKHFEYSHRKNLVGYGQVINDSQTEFLNRLKSLISIDSLSVIGGSKAYKGFYVGESYDNDKSKSALAWLGFQLMSKGGLEKLDYGREGVTFSICLNGLLSEGVSTEFNKWFVSNDELNKHRPPEWVSHESKTIESNKVWYLREGKINNVSDKIEVFAETIASVFIGSNTLK